MKAFDRKFGTEFIGGVPSSPGIYRVFDLRGALVYVGKAKNLRARLAQYRNAKRRKKYMKMRTVVADGARIELEVCASHLEACLLEATLIRDHRPRHNIAGAYCFLYPMIGARIDVGTVWFCCTTSPGKFPAYAFHGAYRSRHVTREAFFALMDLLQYVGHAIPRKSIRRVERFSYEFGFRQLPSEWLTRLEKFWRGESTEALEELVLALVENAGARSKRSGVQDLFDKLKLFWRDEALPLKAARETCGFAAYPVPQTERDLIFLRHRLQDEIVRT